MADLDETKTDATPESNKEDFLATARRRFEDASGDEQMIREQATLDLRFVAGDQWDTSVKTNRIAAGRPALTFNRCHTFVQSVANEARQNRGEIKFIAPDDERKETAEIFEGLARHIQYNSTAKVAYETAVDYSAGGSFGYYRFMPEYHDDEGWDQDIKVLPVHDPFSVYGVLIPACFGLKPEYAFVVSEIPLEKYKREYPQSEANRVGWDQAAKLSQGWISTDTVRVAEYWYLEHNKKTLKDGDRTREVDDVKVKFCKINGLEVLEGTETEWLGRRIPIFPVLGKLMFVDGKPSVLSVVRFQRDPQQLINFYKTRIAETLGTAPIQPYMVAEGQIQGHEKEWLELNSTMRPYLTYKPKDVNGSVIGAPQRQVFEAPIGSLSEAAAQEIDDMKAVAGIFDASLGNKGNETSGKGIMARQQQSNVTNMHFLDNLERSMDESGTELAYAIPNYYDSARTIRILGADDKAKLVKINQKFTENGKSKHYKLDDATDYDVMVTMGRSFSTKRMESFDMIGQILQANQNLLPMIGDIFFRNSDVAGAEQLAERFEKMLPPQLQPQKDGEQIPPQAQAAIAQLQQHNQALNAYAQQLEQEKQGRLVEAQAKATIAQMQEMSKQEIVRMQEATKLAVAQINASKDANQAIADSEIEQYKLLHNAAHDIAMQKDQQAHDANMAQQQAVNAAASQASDQAHQQQMAQDSASPDNGQADGEANG